MTNKIDSGITVPVTTVAGAASNDISPDLCQEGDILTTSAEPSNPFDKEAVAFYYGNSKLGYIPKDSVWRDYHEQITFTVREVKANAKGFVKHIYVNISGHQLLSDVIQDNQTAKPYYDIASEDGYRIYWKEGKHLPSITSVLGVKIEEEQLKRWMLTHDDYNHYIGKLGWYAERGTIVHNALEDYMETKEVYNTSHFIQKDKEYREGIEAHNTKRQKSIDSYGYSKLVEKKYFSLNFDKKGKIGGTAYKETHHAMHQMYMGGINFLQGTEMIEAERMLFSKKYGIAGSCDVLLRYKGELFAVDYKTSKSVRKKSYSLQATFYASAYTELPEITNNEKPKAALLRLDPFTKKGYQFVEVENQSTHEAMIPYIKNVFEYFTSKL